MTILDVTVLDIAAFFVCLAAVLSFIFYTPTKENETYYRAEPLPLVMPDFINHLKSKGENTFCGFTVETLSNYAMSEMPTSFIISANLKFSEGK